jgi:hypothetical protein
MALHFIPLAPGQVRGISIISLAAWDMQDLEESRRFELLAQKAGAGRMFQEWNEEGEAAPGSDHIIGPTSGEDGSATPSGLWREVIDGGINTYFKSSDPASRLEAVKFDRPSSNQQSFSAQVWREALAGSGLSIDFNSDLTKIGGASLRVLIDKINRNHIAMQEVVLEPAIRRFDVFRMAQWMAGGLLPVTDDWMNFEYQRPAVLTADKRYNSDVDAQEVRIGIKTRTQAVAERGECLYDLRDQREAELRDLLRRAQAIATEFGITIDSALARLENDVLIAPPPSEEPPAPNNFRP